MTGWSGPDKLLGPVSGEREPPWPVAALHHNDVSLCVYLHVIEIKTRSASGSGLVVSPGRQCSGTGHRPHRQTSMVAGHHGVGYDRQATDGWPRPDRSERSRKAEDSGPCSL